MKKYNRVPLELLIPHFSFWREVLLSDAIGQIFTTAYGDASYRSLQFIDWAAGKHGDKYELHDMEELELSTFREVLAKSKKPIILMAGDLLFGPQGVKFAKQVERLSLETGKGVLIFHEGFVSQIEDKKPMLPTSFFQYQSIFGLHTKETTLGFLKKLASDLKVAVNEKQMEAIYRQCGGVLWLVSSCVRSMKEGVDFEKVFETADFAQKSRLFWKSLPDTHKQVLAGVSDDADVKLELGDYGFYISHSGDNPGFLDKFTGTDDKEDFVISERQLVFLGKDLTDTFTKSERRLLSYAFDHLEVVMSRDEWGRVYWGDSFEDNYSDWALDKTISRLRDKLTATKLPILIVTKRGEGYLVRSKYRRS